MSQRWLRTVILQGCESSCKYAPAMTCHSLDCARTPCSLGLCRAFHQGLTSYPFNKSGKTIAHPICWLLSGVVSPSKFACLPQTSTTVTKSPRICHGNTLLEDLAVFVPRARHGWSGILRLTRSPFPFCHRGSLAFCSNDAKQRSVCKPLHRFRAIP